MSDSPTPPAAKKSRFRPTEGQRFPSDPLGAALDRARALYRLAQGTPIPVPAASVCWGYTEKSSGGPQTVSCLKMFGLLQDSGSGDARRVKLSEDAIKIIRDPRDLSPERDALIREAALRPPLHREIIQHFGGTLPPSDEALKVHLMFDVGLRDETVGDCMKVFAETMAFAKIGTSSIISPETEANPGNGAKRIQVGAVVQWASGGVLQFQEPRAVTSLSDDGRFVFVEGSATGLPVEEIEVMEQPPPTAQTPAMKPTAMSEGTPPPGTAHIVSVVAQKPEIRPLAPLKGGMERASFPLQGGLAVVEMPAELSREDYEDFETWMQLVLRKAKRSIRPN